MKLKFPELPTYEYGWRSLQIEPIPSSGERITLGAIVKGEDKALIAAKLVSHSKLKSIYGGKLARRISDALNLSIESAERFYDRNPLSTEWIPPLERFYVGKLRSSVAEDIDDGLHRAAMHCSSISASLELGKQKDRAGRPLSAPEQWRKNIQNAVRMRDERIINFFGRRVPLRGRGVPLTFSFLSRNYAAQFDAISGAKSIQSVLVRAQSKLWQLDCLRDAQDQEMFKPELYELLIQTPVNVSDESDALALKEFIEEVKYEANRKDLKVFSTNSPDEAAKHLISVHGETV